MNATNNIIHNDEGQLIDCTYYANRTGRLKLPCKISTDAFIKLHEVSDGLSWGVPVECALRAYTHVIQEYVHYRDTLNAQQVKFVLFFEKTPVLLSASIEVSHASLILVVRLAHWTSLDINGYGEELHDFLKMA